MTLDSGDLVVEPERCSAFVDSEGVEAVFGIVTVVRVGLIVGSK